MDVHIEGPDLKTASLCAPILRALPAWFGIEEAIVRYITEIDHLPTLLAYEAERVIGFLSLKQHTPYSAEIYVMGVLPEAQRRGIGRVLIDRAQAWLKEHDVEYLQVKTLGPSRADAGYAKTRTFYAAMGFRPLEEFTQIWDESNPCLIMVKRL
ncbi:MAG: GNAT family N-acetyltransferase [Anaerolineales bacterium]|nr:GNAT family N-acetyltransferase [Anaerolineales bacterium]